MFLKERIWIRNILVIITLLFLLVGSFNFLIDPLWTFDHSNRYNNIQDEINERQQKTNYIYFNRLDRYEGILFGSSRSTFINQNNFHNMNIYNYALDSMYPFEYEQYFNFAKKVKGKDFKYLIIGADFYNIMKPRKREFKDPSYYIDTTTGFLYRYRMLLAWDVLKYSMKNIRNSICNINSLHYSRVNIKFIPKVTEKVRLKRYRKNLKRHVESFTGRNYQKNDEYMNILKRLKSENSNTKIIIFTSPITADLLDSIIVNAKKMKEYENWLKDLISIFGEIHHFMDLNSITINLENYFDDDHFYPYIGKLLANKISKKNNHDIPKDFGVILNKSNVDQYLNTFKQKIKDYNIKEMN